MRPASTLFLVLCGLIAAHGQDFPCPAVSGDYDDLTGGDSSPPSPALAGGYQSVDLTENSALDLLTLANASFVEWLAHDDNVTICSGDVSSLLDYGIEIISACSQVVAGTNYGLQYLAQVDCLRNVTADDTALITDRLVMDAIVFVPLPIGENSSPQVQQVYPDPGSFGEERIIDGVEVEPLPPLSSIAGAPNDPTLTVTAPSPTVIPGPPSERKLLGSW